RILHPLVTGSQPSPFQSLAPVTLPPPDATANVTATFGTGLLNWSRTSTAGAVATAVPTGALWFSPAVITRELALPAVPVAVNVTLGRAACRASVCFWHAG